MDLFRLCLVNSPTGLEAWGIKRELKREVLSRFRSLELSAAELGAYLPEWIRTRQVLLARVGAEGATAARQVVEQTRARQHRLEQCQSIFSDDARLAELDEAPNKVMIVAADSGPEDMLLARRLSEALDPLGEVADTPPAPREKLLLHVCCGPDAAGVLGQLKREFDLVAFWYDPNIQPREEHDLRLDAFLKVASLEGVPAIVGEYDLEHFYARIRGLEHTPEQGAKCSHCYDLRLERAAVEAKSRGCDLYATTLAISPHKVQEKLVAFGELNQKKYGVPYFHRNFMKDDGFKDSVAYTREHEIYRQDYCGCWFSLHEGGPAAQAYAERKGLLKGTDGRFATSAPPDSDAEGWLAYQQALVGADPSTLKG